jgi:hypothetical protein
MRDLALILLGALRLTRFITSDKLGYWWVVQPARRWAMYGTALYHSPAEVIEAEWEGGAPTTPRQRLVSGLDCPFCVGFWLGALALVGTLLIGRVPVLGALWRLGLGALGLNYIVGHISARLDG